MDVAFIEKLEERNREKYKDRKFLYLFPNINGNYFAVNYDAINCALNSFLTLFDVWGNKSGHHKVSEDGNCQEVWFEVDAEFFKLATETMTFNRAFKNLGIKVVTEYPFIKKKDEWSEDWRGMAKAVKNLFEWEEWEECHMKICELKVDRKDSLQELVYHLTANGYKVDVGVVWKEYPNSGIDYWMIAIFDKE